MVSFPSLAHTLRSKFGAAAPLYSRSLTILIFQDALYLLFCSTLAYKKPKQHEFNQSSISMICNNIFMTNYTLTAIIL